MAGRVRAGADPSRPPPASCLIAQYHPRLPHPFTVHGCQDIGPDYAVTLRAWRNAWEARQEEVSPKHVAVATLMPGDGGHAWLPRLRHLVPEGRAVQVPGMRHLDRTAPDPASCAALTPLRLRAGAGSGVQRAVLAQVPLLLCVLRGRL